MIKSDGNAPYAPTPAVLSVIDAYRNRPVPAPITTEVIQKIGVSDSIVARTLQALKLLDLLDEDGNPTAAMDDLRKVGEDDFQGRLADVVRAAYAEIFAYRDPATDDPSKIRDAFRHYKPITMGDQMTRLFLGLCEAAGIIAAKPQVTKPNATKARSRTFPKPVTSKRSEVAPTETTIKTSLATGGRAPTPTGVTYALPTQAGADHMLIRGLLQTLPDVGAVWSDEQRREWADAATAAFNLIYKRPSPENGGS